ncbi:hypothetical protein LY78DRAFT_660462 [Colletotrichum sublineola]|nr:hypothetical protein LY78DRAFT_660462 [Colletotrichum sublineola]
MHTATESFWFGKTSQAICRGQPIHRHRHTYTRTHTLLDGQHSLLGNDSNRTRQIHHSTKNKKRLRTLLGTLRPSSFLYPLWEGSRGAILHSIRTFPPSKEDPEDWARPVPVPAPSQRPPALRPWFWFFKLAGPAAFLTHFGNTPSRNVVKLLGFGGCVGAITRRPPPVEEI